MKKINMKKRIYLIIGILSVILMTYLAFRPISKKINGLVMLIEFEHIDGVLQWEKELDNRGINALIKVQDNVLQDHPGVFKRLSDKGYEIAGGYDLAPFWGMPYEDQYTYLKEAQGLVKEVTGKDMRVFGSRYFAYDENTLKAADELGIEYILARGTQGVEAVIYAPEEYDVKVISVSNVEFEEMGKGSLCDYSLWVRGATHEDFDLALKDAIKRKPKSMIVVSHAYLGGTRQNWWNIYEEVLRSDKISFVGFEDWLSNVLVLQMPNKDIPLNMEVKYDSPSPSMPIEEMDPVENLNEIYEEYDCEENSDLPYCS
jgi:hypothetical protein